MQAGQSSPIRQTCASISFPPIEHLSDSPGCFPHHQWFREKSPNPHLFGLRFIDQCTVPGAKDNRDVGPNLHEPPGEIRTSHVGHGLICENKVEMVGMGAKGFQGFNAARSNNYLITKTLEHLPARVNKAFLIVNEQYPFLLSGKNSEFLPFQSVFEVGDPGQKPERYSPYQAHYGLVWLPHSL